MPNFAAAAAAAGRREKINGIKEIIWRSFTNCRSLAPDHTQCTYILVSCVKRRSHVYDLIVLCRLRSGRGAVNW